MGSENTALATPTEKIEQIAQEQAEKYGVIFGGSFAPGFDG